MDKIGPKEAAETIREDFQREHVDAHFQHQVRFAGDVLGELHQEKTPENVAKTMRLLDKHGIEGHAFNDFPKWVQNERGERAVVNDEDHEQAFMSRPAPADENGVPNPEHGHVDPATGVFVDGMPNRLPEPYGFMAPPPYEPGAVDVIEPGGKKGPPASPVSDNRTNIQENIDPMRGTSQFPGGQGLGDTQLVTKAKQGEVFVEPSNQHGQGANNALNQNAAQNSQFAASGNLAAEPNRDQTEWRTPEQIASGVPLDRSKPSPDPVDTRFTAADRPSPVPPGHPNV